MSSPFHPRAVEEVRWLSLGKSAAEIAEIMGVNKWTVQVDLRNAKEATGSATACALVAHCLREGIIQ